MAPHERETVPGGDPVASAPGISPAASDGLPAPASRLLDARGRAGVHPNVLRPALLATAALAIAYWTGPRLGLAFGLPILLILLLGSVAMRLFPLHSYLVAGLTGVAVLWQWASLRYFSLHLMLVAGAFLLRSRPWVLASYLAVGILILPKELFRLFYNWQFLHDWLNPFLLAHVLFLTAYWWQSRKRGKATETGLSAWLAYFLFPGHPMNPLPLAPADVWRARTADARAILESVGLLLAKAAVLLAMARLLPAGRLEAQSPAQLLGLSLPALWGAVFLSYLNVALTLSGAADVAILIARLFGWNLPHHFRFALLAWNPVELWRRWAIYNRRLLLTTVYFPLGGGQRRRYLNVLLTFLASGVFLHSGWVGGKYWEVGAGGWRDQTVYFLLQGLAVCGCLLFWQLSGKDPASDKQLRWSWGRLATTVGTQALSAWLHIIVLAQHVDWQDRWRLMARCLGIH